MDMTQAMSNENRSGGDSIHTTTKVDRTVWRQLRSKPIAAGKTVSSELDNVLTDYFDIKNRH